jgi:hypothetical protein
MAKTRSMFIWSEIAVLPLTANRGEMPETPETPPAAEPLAMPETTALLLAAFADLHRQEVAAEEDVYRTLPFFGTALGIVLGARAYAGGRLPRWPDLTTAASVWAFAIASALLGLAFIEAGLVLGDKQE